MPSRKRPRGRPNKFTVAQVERALRANAGIKLATANALGCSRTTVKKYLDDSPTLQRALEDIRESMIDAAEHQVIRGIANGDRAMIMFYLRCQGRHRGWSDGGGQLAQAVAEAEQVKEIRLVFDDGAGERLLTGNA